MPGCVLRAYGSEDGEDFAVDAFLSSSAFSACRVSHRGVARHAKSRKADRASGFNVVVSQAEGDQVPVQIRDAMEFLAANRDELRRLASFRGVEVVYLDFGWDVPYERSCGEFNRFPIGLLRECAALGVEIEVSVYAIGGEVDDEE